MTAPAPAQPLRAFHVMTKPIGPICNLDCKYCFYLEKEKLYPGTAGAGFRMTDETLERYIQQYIEGQSGPEISFAWQGGEPTMMGVAFFRRVVELQTQYCPPGRRITNALQTNGTLLDDEWCHFLAEHKFLVGLSIDGPREMHDHYRVDKGGRPTFDKVMRGLELLKKHGVEFNTLTVVNRVNSQHPLEVYRFLREIGSGFMQFIPLVERAGDEDFLAGPPDLERAEPRSPVTGWSVESRTYGEFLSVMFDEWVRRDVGTVFVQMFEVQLAIWMGMPSSLCVFAETCGNAVAMEHNGDLYSCDHFVYPEHKLGNIADVSLAEMLASPRQRKFGTDKQEALPRYCRECEVRFACNGECPKHRFIRTPDGEPGLNYLCAGYKHFFNYIDPYMRTLAQLVQSRRPAQEIMPMIARRDEELAWKNVSRNSPCPCGSGKKYKVCCARK